MKLTLKILVLLVIASFLYAEDVNIDQSIEIAIKNSPTVKTYTEQVAQAKHTIGLANAYLNPTINGDANYKFMNKTEIEGVPYGADRTSTVGVDVSMPIDIGGQLHVYQKGAKSMYNSSEFALNNAIIEVIENVKTNYLMCLLYRENINTAKSALALSEDYLKKVKAEVEAGTKAKFDITRQEYEVESRKTKLIQAQNDYDESINTFNLSLGLDKDFVTPISLDDLNLANIKDIQLDLIKIAYENRSDLRGAMQDLETAKISLLSQKKTNNPSLSINAGYDYLLENRMGYDNRNTWSAGANFSVPIFDGGIQAANTKIYESKVKAQETVVESKKDTIVNGVLNAKLSALSNLSKIDSCNSGVNLAKESYDIAKLRYEQNLGTYLDVSSALDGLVSAQDALASSKYNYAISLVQLEREMGVTDKVDDYTNAIILDVTKKKDTKKETKQEVKEETTKGDNNEK